MGLRTPTTYYPGSASVEEARKLTIAPGQVLTEINMTLRPQRAGRISGVALDSSGAPFANAAVVVFPRVGGGSKKTATKQSDR